MIFIFTKRLSPRLSYAAEHIFKNVLATPYTISDNITNKRSEDLVLGYGFEKADNHFSIFQSSFLIDNLAPELKIYNEIIANKWPYFFNDSSDFDYKTDVFSLCFFALTRYEEYVLTGQDQFGRFSANQSVFYRDNLLHIPYLDRLIFEFAQEIQHKYPKFQFGAKPTEIRLSFDIDHAWKYKNKGWLRNFGGTIKNLLMLDFKSIAERLCVLTGFKADPYDTFHEIYKLAELVKIEFFILLGDYNKLDINIPYNNHAFRKLIKQISSKFQTGIHPSSKAFNNLTNLEKEIKRLNQITVKTTFSSRQHFLLLHLPDTYKFLIKSGIRDENTMGFADAIGFRSGTSHPYRWFDFEKNDKTELWIHPFIAMDVTMRDYLKMTPEQAFGQLTMLFNEVKKYGGDFGILWHNSSFLDSEGWEDWKKELIAFLINNLGTNFAE